LANNFCIRDNEISNLIAEVIEKAKSFTEIKLFHDPVIAVENADVVYTDVWLSMGEEEHIEKKKNLKILQVNVNDSSNRQN